MNSLHLAISTQQLLLIVRHLQTKKQALAPIANERRKSNICWLNPSNATLAKVQKLIILGLFLLLASCVQGQGQPAQSVTAPTDATPAAIQEAEPEESKPEVAEEEPTTPSQDIDLQSAEQESTPADSETSEADQSSNEAFVFQLDPDGTEARFIVDEILMGNDKTVIGVTSDVTGEITVVPSTPSTSQIGIITINARDFKTDSSRRNRAIQRQVLLTAKEEYQFITFTPTALEGLPESIGVGDTVSFSVVGDLTILDATRSETFEMSITVVSEQELTGLASTTVLYADYGISIPKVPIVASVEDEVRLELEFIAKAQ